MKKSLVWGLAALLLTTVLSPETALAGGRGNGKPSGGGGTATLVLTPNPTAAGSQYSVTGSGFAPNKYIIVGVTHSSSPWTAWYYSVSSDGSGSFSFQWYAGPEGEARHDPYQQ